MIPQELNNSDNFISHMESQSGRFPASPLTESGGTDEGSGTERKLVSKILNKEPYEPELKKLNSLEVRKLQLLCPLQVR